MRSLTHSFTPQQIPSFILVDVLGIYSLPSSAPKGCNNGYNSNVKEKCSNHDFKKFSMGVGNPVLANQRSTSGEWTVLGWLKGESRTLLFPGKIYPYFWTPYFNPTKLLPAITGKLFSVVTAGFRPLEVWNPNKTTGPPPKCDSKWK